CHWLYRCPPSRAQAVLRVSFDLVGRNGAAFRAYRICAEHAPRDWRAARCDFAMLARLELVVAACYPFPITNDVAHRIRRNFCRRAPLERILERPRVFCRMGKR